MIRTALHIPGEAFPRLFLDAQAAVDWLLTTDYAHRPLIDLIRQGLRIETARLHEKPRLWVNVWWDGHGSLYPSREEADRMAEKVDVERIACVPVTYAEGEGL